MTGMETKRPAGRVLLVLALAALPSRAAELSLTADKTCYGSAGATVSVSVDLTNAGAVVVGGQFFLRYDPSVLQFQDMVPGDPPFVVEIYDVPGDGGPGTIDYAVGTISGGPGTAADSTMAVVRFTALTEFCGLPGLVSFRPHDPPTKLSGEVGADIPFTSTDLGSVLIDVVPPAISCPSDMIVTVGQSTDPSATGMASATDNCDGSPAITHADTVTLGTCPTISVIARSWTATDSCGHTDVCSQTIEVRDADSDGDGVANCADGCPQDPNKTSVGLCGCGVADTDSDGDTFPDCVDRCPAADDRVDADNNGIPDCLEQGIVPTASAWGLGLMALLLLVGYRVVFSRRRMA